jgi:hypothetical protein
MGVPKTPVNCRTTAGHFAPIAPPPPLNKKFGSRSCAPRTRVWASALDRAPAVEGRPFGLKARLEPPTLPVVSKNSQESPSL